MITKEQAIEAGLRHGTALHVGTCRTIIGPRGGQTTKVETWRANGVCKVWKLTPERFSLPIKYGFRGPYSYLTEQNAKDFHLAADCVPELLYR